MQCLFLISATEWLKRAGHISPITQMTLPWISGSGSPACSGRASGQTCWVPLCARSHTSSSPWTGPGVRTTYQNIHSSRHWSINDGATKNNEQKSSLDWNGIRYTNELNFKDIRHIWTLLSFTKWTQNKFYQLSPITFQESWVCVKAIKYIIYIYQLGYHYLAIVNDHRPKLLACLSIVKGSAGFTDLDQQGLPLGKVFTQTVVDVLSLHVPQALVLQPHLEADNQEKSAYYRLKLNMKMNIQDYNKFSRSMARKRGLKRTACFGI